MDWRASSAGKRVECWGKSQTLGKRVEHGERRWERASEQAAVEQGVKRSTAPRASADMQNKGEMCKTCKIAKHVKLAKHVKPAQFCISLQVGKFGLT